jgi:hypothetical protein
MAQAALPFPTSSFPGGIPGEGDGRLINALAQQDGSYIRIFRTPGLTAIPGMGNNTLPRGGLLVGPVLYQARTGSLYYYTSALTVGTLVGALAGAKPISMARNNRESTGGAPGPDIVIVSEYGVQVLVPNGTIKDYPVSRSDPDDPGPNPIGTPLDVAFLDGYFLFAYTDGTVRATGTAATPTNTLDLSDLSYTVCEGNPDGLLRVTARGGKAWCWGTASVEVWSDAGLSPFPLARDTVIPIGLRSQWAVAGFEDGWDGPQIFVAADGTVRRMDGYQPSRISTLQVERSIAAADPANLRAMVYTFGGNPIWSLTDQTSFTWEYNLTTGNWHERASQGMAYWRGLTSINAFGKWVIGDRKTGAAAKLDTGSFVDLDTPITARIESGPLRTFPDRARVSDLQVDITTGQAMAAAQNEGKSDPECIITWSMDGGMSWSNPLVRLINQQGRSIGQQGSSGYRVSVGDLGRTTREGVRVAIEVSDPVQFSFRGAAVREAAVRKSA